MIDWSVGDKLVCIDDTNTPGYTPLRPNCRLKPSARTTLPGIVAGQIYTIRWIGVFEAPYCHPIVGVRLMGSSGKMSGMARRAKR